MIPVPVHSRPCVDQGQGIYNQPTVLQMDSIVTPRPFELAIPNNSANVTIHKQLQLQIHCLERVFLILYPRNQLMNTFVAKALIETTLGLRLVLQARL